VLGALPPASADDRPDERRHLEASAIHIAVFRGDVHDLVEGEEQEVHPDVDLDRIEAIEGGPDRDAGHALLRERGVDDPGSPELVGHP